MGIKSKMTQGDSNLLKVNKDINREILNQKDGLTDIKSLDKQILKNKDAINKAQTVSEGLNKRIGAEGRKNLGYVQGNATRIANLQKEREKLLLNAKNFGKEENNRIKQIEQEIKNRDATLTKQVQGLTTAEQQALFTKQNIKLLEEENEKRKEELKNIQQAEKSLGVFGGVLKGISKIPLFGDLVDADEAFEAAKEAALEVKDDGSSIFSAKGLAGMAAGAKVLG